MATFKNRIDAGVKILNEIKGALKDISIDVIAAIPNGGVYVAQPLAIFLKKEIKLMVVKKIPASFNIELGVGAVTLNGTAYLNHALIRKLNEKKEYIQKIKQEKINEAKKKGEMFKDWLLDSSSIYGRKVLIVDDGAATGATLLAAIKELRSKSAKVFVALPVASDEVCKKLKKINVDYKILICDPFLEGVGEYYDDFRSIDDYELLEFLKQIQV